MASDPSKSGRGPMRQLVREKSLLRWHALLLIAVSVGDLLMTYILLSRHPKFYESNPIAGWVFNRWNITGMTAFKFGLVAFIILICETIERRRPRLGRYVMLLGILGTLYGIVVGSRPLLEHG